MALAIAISESGVVPESRVLRNQYARKASKVVSKKNNIVYNIFIFTKGLRRIGGRNQTNCYEKRIISI